LFLFVVIVWAYFLERRRINHYGTALAAVHAIPPAEITLLCSPGHRMMGSLRALLRGDFQRWWRMMRYYTQVTKAAFLWHRLNSGDERARERLRRQEQAFLQLRRVLVANNQMAVQ